MKLFILSILSLGLTTSAYSAPNCSRVAKAAALAQAKKRDDESKVIKSREIYKKIQPRSISARQLHQVFISDQTDPSDYMVAIYVTRTKCKVEYVARFGDPTG